MNAPMGVKETDQSRLLGAWLVFDNGGRTFDRYSIYLGYGEYLGVGETGNVPNGICQHSEGLPPSQLGAVLGVQVPLDRVPEPVRAAVRAEADVWAATMNAAEMRALIDHLADEATILRLRGAA